ncbi:hypothetical protein K2F54_14275 [Cryobacterium sp. 1639]|uniref:hypothetical protein n=1 Tax=Cryobacterium inferilacus TaxID=2866629 RepID=UPI001C73376D|nr:hypothetical protein [Cryobacterium sp. 1639]MBX0301138.1 hypothetical protein [Cryobacterium sp. 1639]
MTDNTTQHAREFAEDAAAQAGNLADQARQAIDETVATAKAALSDVDTGAALASAQEFAAGTLEKVTAAYKKNPALVISIGSAALVAVALISKRR